MEKELSIQEIINSKESIKEIVRNNDSKRLYYEIRIQNPIISNQPQTFATGNNRAGSCYKKFCSDLDSVLLNNDVVSVSVELKNGQGRTIGTYNLPLVKPQKNYIEIYNKNNNLQEHAHARPYESVQQQTAQQSPNADMIKGVISLLGFDVQGLDGVNDQFGGLGAVMAIREKQVENRFMEREREETKNKLIAEKAKLEITIDELTKKLAKADKEIESLNGTIDELQDEIESLEKLKPEYSLAGTSLVGVLTKVGENLISKNAGLIGNLMGVDETTMRGILTKEEAQTPINNVEVTPAKQSPREQKINAISNFLKSLPDTEFSQIWELMQQFYRNKQSINICYRWAFAKQDSVQGEIETDEDIEIEKVELDE